MSWNAGEPAVVLAWASVVTLFTMMLVPGGDRQARG